MVRCKACEDKRNRSLLCVNEDFEGKHNAAYCRLHLYTIKIRINGKMQGLRSLRNRSLLDVNEDFEGKRNAADCRLDGF